MPGRGARPRQAMATTTTAPRLSPPAASGPEGALLDHRPLEVEPRGVRRPLVEGARLEAEVLRVVGEVAQGLAHDRGHLPGHGQDGRRKRLREVLFYPDPLIRCVHADLHAQQIWRPRVRPEEGEGEEEAM